MRSVYIVELALVALMLSHFYDIFQQPDLCLACIHALFQIAKDIFPVGKIGIPQKSLESACFYVFMFYQGFLLFLLLSKKKMGYALLLIFILGHWALTYATDILLLQFYYWDFAQSVENMKFILLMGASSYLYGSVNWHNHSCQQNTKINSK